MLKLAKKVILTLTNSKSMDPGFSTIKESSFTTREFLDISQYNYKLMGSAHNPLLIMIHGLTSALQTFLNVATDFSSQYQVLIYDQRGHGQSPIASYDYTLDSMASDLNSLLNYLKLQQKDFVVLGHSAGGRTALRFCELFPQGVKTLIIEDMDIVPAKTDNLSNIVKKANRLKELPEDFKDIKSFCEILGEFYKEHEIENMLQRKIIQNKDGSIHLLFKPWVACLYQYFYKNSDFTKFCQNFDKPTLILEAEKESAIREKGNIAIKKCKNKNIQQIKIKGSTHTIHLGQKDKFIEVVLKFLKGV